MHSGFPSRAVLALDCLEGEHGHLMKRCRNLERCLHGIVHACDFPSHKAIAFDGSGRETNRFASLEWYVSGNERCMSG